MPVSSDSIVLQLLIDSVLESLTGLESGNLGSRDLDLSIGSGIYACTSVSLSSLKGTEANDLDLVAGSDGVYDGVKGSGYSSLCVLLGNSSLLSYDCDEF